MSVVVGAQADLDSLLFSHHVFFSTIEQVEGKDRQILYCMHATRRFDALWIYDKRISFLDQHSYCTVRMRHSRSRFDMNRFDWMEFETYCSFFLWIAIFSLVLLFYCDFFTFEFQFLRNFFTIQLQFFYFWIEISLLMNWTFFSLFNWILFERNCNFFDILYCSSLELQLFCFWFVFFYFWIAISLIFNSILNCKKIEMAHFLNETFWNLFSVFCLKFVSAKWKRGRRRRKKKKKNWRNEKIKKNRRRKVKKEKRRRRKVRNKKKA